MGDSFNSTLFKETFKRVFEKVPARQQGGPEYLEMGFNAILEVKVDDLYIVKKLFQGFFSRLVRN